MTRRPLSITSAPPRRTRVPGQRATEVARRGAPACRPSSAAAPWFPSCAVLRRPSRASARHPGDASGQAADPPSCEGSTPAKKERTDPASCTRLLVEFTPLVQQDRRWRFQRRLPRNVLQSAGPRSPRAWPVSGTRFAVTATSTTRASSGTSASACAAPSSTSSALKTGSPVARAARLRPRPTARRRASFASMTWANGSKAVASAVIPPEAESELAECFLRESLARAVETLPERERLIVSEHYFNHVKFKSLGERLGVSEPRISQLHSRAMQRLRSAVSQESLL